MGQYNGFVKNVQVTSKKPEPIMRPLEDFEIKDLKNYKDLTPMQISYIQNIWMQSPQPKTEKNRWLVKLIPPLVAGLLFIPLVTANPIILNIVTLAIFYLWLCSILMPLGTTIALVGMISKREEELVLFSRATMNLFHKGIFSPMAVVWFGINIVLLAATGHFFTMAALATASLIAVFLLFIGKSTIDEGLKKISQNDDL